MTTIKKLPVLFFTLLLFLNFQCIPDDDSPIFSNYEPVFLSRSEFENAISIKASQPIINSGKIYVKDNFLFVNELREGFHVIDNSDPKNPKRIKFIQIPGATDLAIRDDVLFINQATDLVSAEFNGNNSITLTKRIREIFPELLSPDGFYADEIPEDAVVVNWKLKN